MIKVLLVDDDSRVLNAITRHLEDREFEVECAVSAGEAEVLLNRQKFDTIVCDNNMCGTKGIRLMAQAKRKHPDMVRIMLTGGLTKSEEVLLKQEIGVAALFNKPCDIEKLTQAIYLAAYEGKP